MELTDEALLYQLKNDNASAFKILYQRYWKRCYALAFQKTGLKYAAEEITQNIFISLWERRQAVVIQNVEAYLFTSVKYQVLNFIESRLTREKYATRLPPQYFNENTVENTVFLRDLRQALEKSLSELPEKTQEIYRLSRFDGLSGKQISEHLQISDKVVEYHISQALKYLREQLKAYL